MKNDPQLPLAWGSLKTCLKCQKQKPCEQYYVSKNSKDGRRPTCIDCWRVINKKTPEQNREYRAKNLERLRARDRARIKPECMIRKKAAYDLRRRKLTQKESIERKFKRHYGISLDQYDELFKKQNGVCAICFKPEVAKSNRSEKRKRLAVDHCHTTGVIRELLCQGCNTALGLLKDNPTAAENAATYLKKHRFKLIGE